MYLGIDGKLYKSYKEYANSPDLDPEDIYYKLLAGVRTPQNEYEKKVKAEMDEIIANGGIIETNLNF